MEENIITWNVPNWVTVVLMATLGFGIISVVASFMRKKNGAPMADE
jgi:hypothetical protein